MINYGVAKVDIENTKMIIYEFWKTGKKKIEQSRLKEKLETDK